MLDSLKRYVAKTYAYVGEASGEAEGEIIDSMEIEVPSAKDVQQQTMPHTPLKSHGPKRVKPVQEKDEISTSFCTPPSKASVVSLTRIQNTFAPLNSN